MERDERNRRATSSNTGAFSAHKPGATSSARWMGQVLYCQKKFLWADQLSYDSEFFAKLQRIKVFIAFFQVPAYLKSSIG